LPGRGGAARQKIPVDRRARRQLFPHTVKLGSFFAAMIPPNSAWIARENLMGRGRLLLILIGLLVVLAGSAAGLYFTGALPKLLATISPPVEAGKEAKPKVKTGPTTATGFFDLPEILVMIDPQGAKSRPLLRMLISLQLASQEDASRAQAYLPRLLDVCQIYLRTLSIADIRGPEKQSKIRAELLKRLNGAVAPLEIQALLFREVAIE
jgi:flagellar protein FliL